MTSTHVLTVLARLCATKAASGPWRTLQGDTAMNSLIAQVAALACHLNARCRGFKVEPMLPGNSTCRICAFVRFVQKVPRPSRIADLPECIETPDEGIEALVRTGVSRGLI